MQMSVPLEVVAPGLVVLEAIYGRHSAESLCFGEGVSQITGQQVDENQPAGQLHGINTFLSGGTSDPILQCCDRQLLVAGHATGQAERKLGLTFDIPFLGAESRNSFFKMTTTVLGLTCPVRNATPKELELSCLFGLKRSIADSRLALLDHYRNPFQLESAVRHPAVGHKKRWPQPLDLCGEHCEPSLNDIPPVGIELVVPVPLNDLGRPHVIFGRQGMLDRFRDQSLGFEPFAGCRMQRINIARGIIPLELPFKQILEKVVVTEPMAFRIQTDYKEILFSLLIDKLPGIILCNSWRDAGSNHGVAQRGAETIQYGCF
jgi:hypothetical protein